PRTITASEAKDDVDAIFDWARSNQDDVIVERQGEPDLVIMPYAEFAQFQAWREEERRREALEWVRTFRAEAEARNQDLTPEEGDALVDRFAREFVEDMI